MDKVQKFWDSQSSSLHRFSDDPFYKTKAAEHVAILKEEHRNCGCIDLGCGAGELLNYISEDVKISIGLDYSDSMLNEAKKRLKGKGIDLLRADLFNYLPTAESKVWITCGAINQYLSIQQQRSFLDIFTNNSTVQALYLYDCVDPIRYSLLPFGISYISSSHTSLTWWQIKYWRNKILRFVRGAAIAIGYYSFPCKKLGGVAMGYGYLPIFWIDECRKRGLQVEIISSRFYEYRYHVLINKRDKNIYDSKR